MIMMNEYRVMFNAYDGKGDREYMITTDALEAVEGKLWIENSICKLKGKSWLECRRVTAWKKPEIK